MIYNFYIFIILVTCKNVTLPFGNVAVLPFGNVAVLARYQNILVM